MCILGLGGNSFAELEFDGLNRVGGSLLAILAKEVEVFTLSLLHADAMAGAVLPDVTLFAGDAVRAIIQIVPVHTTY
jgi:hypothetical protein